MLSSNLDFNSCAIRDGFRKSSHILAFSERFAMHDSCADTPIFAIDRLRHSVLPL